MTKKKLIVIETHPVQYRVPIYRMLQEKFHIPVTVIYGSDFSIKEYRDKEFNESFAWDTDLLSGYAHIFLTKNDIEKILTDLKPGVVMITGYSPGFHRIALDKASQLRYPLIFRSETTDHAIKRSPIKNILRDIALKNIYKKCTHLLYIGKRSYEHFLRLGVAKDKLIFSPYCVDSTYLIQNEREQKKACSLVRNNLKIKENEIVILFSGKLSKRKNPNLLLKAVKKIMKNGQINISVIFLGNGKEINKLKKLAEKPPRVNAYFVGFKNQKELTHYYNASDLLVLPSLYGETWGLVVNEALQHGIPCVVSEAVGCGPDLVEPGLTGETFRTGSVSDLDKALTKAFKLINKPFVRKSCLKKAESYSVQKAARGIEEAYNSVKI